MMNGVSYKWGYVPTQVAPEHRSGIPMGSGAAKFGPYLKRVRERTGLSRARLAAIMDSDQSTICRLEIGTRMPGRGWLDALFAAVPDIMAHERRALYHYAGYVPTDEWEKM